MHEIYVPAYHVQMTPHYLWKYWKYRDRNVMIHIEFTKTVKVDNKLGEFLVSKFKDLDKL